MKVNQENELIHQSIDNLTVDYEQKSIKKLYKNIQTEKEFDDFELFHNMLKNYFAPCLITKEYVRYKNNVRSIVEMNNRLRDIGINTYNNRLNPSALNSLCDLIITEQDFEVFAEIWDKNKHKYGILQVVQLYKDRRTPEGRMQ